MNEQELCLPGGKRHQSATKMGAKTLQFILLGACSLAVSSTVALCAGSEQLVRNNQMARTTQATNTVSYANQPIRAQHQQNQVGPQKQQLQLVAGHDSNMDALDLNFAAANNYNRPLQQQQQVPTVYHSIIDTTSSARQHGLLSPAVQASTSTVGDLNTAAGHHHGHAHGKYYEYRAVPEKKTWKFGYKRGNHKHTISRHEHGKAGKHPHFKTKVKWHDTKSKGKGIHLWDYNHHDKKHYHHG